MERNVVVLFKSRNKDNKNVQGFKERGRAFLWNKNKLPFNRFKHFVDDGLPGEKCRLYVSVNARDVEKVKRELLVKLIEEPNYDLTKIDSLVASIAAKPRNRLENKWLFDVDIEDENRRKLFLEDLAITFRVKMKVGELPDDMHFNVVSTPHGIGVVVPHGFDTREFLDKWKDVTLKRDGMLFVRMEEKDS